MVEAEHCLYRLKPISVSQSCYWLLNDRSRGRLDRLTSIRDLFLDRTNKRQRLYTKPLTFLGWADSCGVSSVKVPCRLFLRGTQTFSSPLHRNSPWSEGPGPVWVAPKPTLRELWAQTQMCVWVICGGIRRGRVHRASLWCMNSDRSPPCTPHAFIHAWDHGFERHVLPRRRRLGGCGGWLRRQVKQAGIYLAIYSQQLCHTNSKFKFFSIGRHCKTNTVCHLKGNMLCLCPRPPCTLGPGTRSIW